MRCVTDNAITFVRPAALTDAAPYAYAAVTRADRAIYTAGACPLDAEGHTVAAGDVVGQAEQVMANLATTLREAGAELSDVVKSTVYVASNRREDLTAVWNVVRAALAITNRPAPFSGGAS